MVEVYFCSHFFANPLALLTAFLKIGLKKFMLNPRTSSTCKLLACMLFALMWTHTQSLAQVTIWLENFSGAPPAPGWTADFTDCDGTGSAGVVGNRFEINDMEGLPCCPTGPTTGGGNDNEWVTNPIDIDGYCNVSITANWGAIGTFECSAGGPYLGSCTTDPTIDNGHDQIIFQYSIDGGPWVQFAYVCGSTPTVISINGLSGNTIRVRILPANKSNAETYWFDDVHIRGFLPTVNTPPNISVCAGQPISVNLTGSAATTFPWTSSNTAIGGPASGPGPTIGPFNAANVSSTQTSTITVTPTQGTCAGTPITFDVTVDPASTVDDPPNQTICSGDPFNLAFTGTGTSFSWTNNNTTSGIPASGSGDISIPVLTNNTASAIVSTITVTPGTPCAGTAQTFTVTVPPRPTMNQPSNITVCGGATANVNFGGAPPGGTYSWVSSNPSTGIPASGTGNVLSEITDLVSSQQVTTITVTPFSSIGCEGVPRTFNITVNPALTVDDPANQSLCSGESLDVMFTGTATNFSWTNNNTTTGIPGSGTGDISTAGLMNNTANSIVSTITVTPTGACAGPSQNFTVTVTPGPTMNQPANITVCGGATATINFGGAPAGSTYSWTSSNPAAGIPASGTGNTLSAPTALVTSQEVTTITVTPSSSTGCVGTPRTFTVTVNPGVSVNDPADESLCAGEPLNVVFTGTASAFTWNNNNMASGIPASGSGSISIASLTNNTTNPIVSTITVTPTGACAGSSQNFTVTVSPSPTMNQPADITVCSGTLATNPFGGAPAGSTYSWSSSNPATGIPASGTGASFSANTANINSVQVSTITVTPSLNGCQGASRTFTVTVQPNPSVAAIPSQTVCSGGAVSVPLSTNPAAIVSWTNSNSASVGGLPAGSANPIAFTANSVISTVTSTFSVSATLGTCTGPATTFTLTVEPIPTVSVPSNIAACPGQQVLANFAPSVTWTNNNPAIGLSASGSGSINYPAPTVAASVSGTIVASVTGAGGCVGSNSFQITIEPAPTVSITAVTCAPNLLTYSVTISTNGDMVTATAGTVSGGAGTFVVSGIPAGTNVDIRSEFGASGCFVLQTVNAPNCSCPPVAAASNPNDPSICSGATIPALTVTGGPGLAVDWYANPSGGAALQSNLTTYTPTVPNTPGTYTFYAETRDIATGCLSSVRTAVTLTVNATPSMSAVASQDTCAGLPFSIVFLGTNGATFNWTNSNTAIGLGASGTGNLNFTVPANLTAAQIANLTVTPQIGTCPGTPQTFSLTGNPSPTLSIGAITCAPNLLTYSVATTSDAASVASTGGSVTGTAPNFTVSSITAGNNVTLTATSAAGCVSTQNVTAPNCNCPPVAAASGPNNPSICEGATIPALSVTAGTGLAVDWYPTASGGATLQTNNTSYTPAGPLAAGMYTFFAETRDLATGCIGPTRTAVTLTVNATPSMSAVASQDTCAGLPFSIVFLGTNGATFNWTNSNTAIGLGASGTGNLNFTVPANLTAAQIANLTVTPQIGTCPGTPQTFSLTGNATPTLTVGTVTCAPNLLTYSAAVSSNANNLTATSGTVSGVSPNFSINNIATGVNITLTATSAAGCVSTQNVTAPNCNCPPVAAASGPNNPSICEGATIPALSVTAGTGLAVDWYPTASGGAPLQTNNTSYTPAGPLAAGTYAFFAETRDLATGCISTTRTPVTLTVNATPTANAVADQVRCGGQSVQINFAGTGSPSFAWTNSNPAIGVAASGTGNLNFTISSSLGAVQTANFAVTPSANGCSGAPVNFSITGVPAPVLTPPTDQSACAGQPIAVNFSATPTGTTFEWTNSNPAIGLGASGTGNIAFSSPAGASGQTGEVVVTPVFMANGTTCMGDAEPLEIAIVTNPTVADPANVTACIGSPIAIPFSGTAGATFSWTNSNPAIGLGAIGTGDISFSAAAAGTANLTVTPQLGAGCTGAAQNFMITVTPAVVAAIAGDNQICAGQNTTLTASGGSTYAWANGPNAANFTVSPIQNTTYTVTVSNAGACSATATVTVVVSQPFNVSVNLITCDPALVGTDTEVLQTVAGCDSVVTTTTSIDLVACAPEATLASDTLDCFGDADGSLALAVTEGFGPYTYAWAGNGLSGTGSIAANGTEELIEDLPAGQYAITVTSANGATSTWTASVVSPTALALNLNPVLAFNGFGVSCAESEDGRINAIVGGGTPPLSYAWSDGQTTANATDLAAGDYTLTVTDARGCTETNGTPLPAPPPVEFTVSSLPIQCGDTELSATVTPTGNNGPYTATLDGEPSNGLRFEIESGIHVIEVIDANGCAADTTLSVELFPEILVALPPDTIITLGTELNLVAQTNLSTWDTIIWTPAADTTRLGTLQQVWTPAETMTIRVEIIDTLGCRGQTTMRIQVREGSIYVPNVFSPNGDGVNDEWRIFADNSVAVVQSVHIFDRWGDAVYAWDQAVPLSAWPGWDGRVRNRPANPGVFVYYAWLELRNGKRVLLEGDINILE
jgi:gliding motility-associated-like protein